MKLLARFIRAAESRPFAGHHIVLAAAWVAGVRYLEERALILDAQAVGGSDSAAATFLIWTCFYLGLGLCVAALLTATAKVEFRPALQVAGFGLLLGVAPPLIDAAIYGRGGFTYWYQSDLSTAALLFSPQTGLPIGESLVVWGTVLLVGAYVFEKTRSWPRALLAGAGQYGFWLLFGVVAFRAAHALSGETLGLEVKCGLFLGVGLAAYLVLRPGLAREALARAPQLALGPAFAFLGAQLAGLDRASTLVATLAFFAACLVFALTNLHHDRREDEALGRTTTVLGDDVAFLVGWVGLATLALVPRHPGLAVALALFLLTAHAYEADPLRIKCVFPLSYKSEGLFAAFALVGGMLADSRHALSARDAWAALLVFGGVSVASPYKDAKDLAGDRAAGVRTLYVVLEGRGWTLEKTHRLARALLFSCLLVPVVGLLAAGEPWPSVLPLFATATFATVAAGWRGRAAGAWVATAGVALYVFILGLVLGT